MTSRLRLTELRNETHVSGFAAACAGAGEFEQRFEEHGLLDEVLVDLGAVEFREVDEEVPALAFLDLDGFLRHHVDGLLGFVGLVLTDISYLGVPRLGGPRRVGLYFRGGRHRFACHPPPKTKPRYAGLVPKGSLFLTRMLQGTFSLFFASDDVRVGNVYIFMV